MRSGGSLNKVMEIQEPLLNQLVNIIKLKH